MIFESFLGSIIIGLIRGGRLKRISYVNFKRAWIFILGFLIQVGIVVVGLNGYEPILKYVKELYIFSYALLFLGIVINIQYKSLWIILIGGILNLIAFVANGGKIPVSIEGLKLAGLENMVAFVESGNLALYTPMVEETKYSFLADMITIPKPYPFPQVISFGDVFIALGLFIFIQSVMLNKGLDRSNMVRFKYRSRI